VQSFDDNGDGWIDNRELQNGFLSFGLGDLNDPAGAFTITFLIQHRLATPTAVFDAALDV